ncbi:MAG: S41 family peptidase [Cytophagaceae bacterium]
MSENSNQNSSWAIKLPLYLSLTLVLGVLLGAGLSGSGNGNSSSSNPSKLMEVIGLIQQDYVDTVNMEELTDYTITKMLEKLDPHTSYIPVSDIQMSHAQLEGDFEGVGIEFNIIKDTIYVISPISGGPSEKAGIQAGDKIVRINEENVGGVGFTSMDVFKRLRGKKGTEVKLGVVRNGSSKILYYNIIRDKIPTYSVDVYYMIDATIGYVKISRFAENTAAEFKAAVKALKEQGMQKLLIDLRENPGGYLNQATNIADELLSGNKLIVYTDGKRDQFDRKYNAGNSGLFEDGDIVVLINEGSASASEILSGAIQDHDRGIIVGRRSFGKGLVQEPKQLKDGSELRLTISRYYTPSGRCIQKPYEKDHPEEYEDELMERYKHGEFFNKDSIKVNDSLVYKTDKGRIVYGGGGIMPDIFVPRDTSDYSKLLVGVLNQNIIREYALEYYQKNKATLEKMSYEQYQKSFEISGAMFNDILKRAQLAKIVYTDSDIQKSKKTIENYMKAYIARGVWGNKGFYPIYNLTDEIYLQGIKAFQEAGKL